MITVRVLDKKRIDEKARRSSRRAGGEGGAAVNEERSLPQETLGLIKTLEGYLLVRNDGVHSRTPRTLDETFLFHFYHPEYLIRAAEETSAQSASNFVAAAALVPDGDISVRELLSMEAGEEPVQTFVNCSGHIAEQNFQLLLKTLESYGVSPEDIDIARMARREATQARDLTSTSPSLRAA